MWDELRAKIKTLNETVWEHRANWPAVERWLGNFSADQPGEKSERLHALFLLSQFMYFGSPELRQLLRSLYRDVFAYPILESIRRANADTTDRRLIGSKFSGEMRATRFLGIGNPSESGTHLLYSFRQENGLPKGLFINSHEIFLRGPNGERLLRDSRVTRYVFLDDICGSGQQAGQYSEDVLKELKALQPQARACYYVLFATSEALDAIRRNTYFDDVQAVFDLDPSFRCFAADSRYFVEPPPDIDKGFAEAMCNRYGRQLTPQNPLGYRNCQLLIGFHHNTPDNTLPIIWYERSGARWTPIFKRYPKIGW
jgi:hypothetical protein